MNNKSTKDVSLHLEKQQKIIEQYVYNLYIDRLKKKIIDEEMTKEEVNFIALATLSLNCNEYEIEISKSDNGFIEIIDLLKNISSYNNVSDKLSIIFKARKEKILNKIDYKIQEMFRLGMGTKKYNQILSIKKSNKSEKEKNKIINKIILELRNTNKNDYIEKVTKLEKLKIIFNKMCKMIDISSINENNLYKNEQYIESIAYLIYNPEIIVLDTCMVYDEWDTFPLKWYLNKKPIQEYRRVFELYKITKSLDKYILTQKQYSIRQIKEILNDEHIHAIIDRRRSVIEEIIDNIEDERWASVVSTCLPTIEGLIWNYAEIIDKRGDDRIFYQSNCNAIIKKDTDIVLKSSKVRELIKETVLKDYFDVSFLDYFCDELYDERNVILHGRCIDKFNELASIKKIITLLYIMEKIQDYMKEGVIELLESKFGDRLDDFIKE